MLYPGDKRLGWTAECKICAGAGSLGARQGRFERWRFSSGTATSIWGRAGQLGVDARPH